MKKKLLLLIGFFCIVSCFTVPFYGWENMTWSYECHDWECFATLRKAVADGDESGIDRFHAYGSNQRVLSNKNRNDKILTLEDAAKVLDSLDRMYVGVLRDSSAEEDRLSLYVVEADGSSVKTYYKAAAGFSLEMQYEEGAMPSLPTSDPLYSMKTTDGDDVPFYYFNNGINAYHYSRLPVENGYLSLVIRHRDIEWTPVIEDSERIDIVKFSEVTAIPTDYTKYLPYAYLAVAVALCMILLPIVFVKFKKANSCGE